MKLFKFVLSVLALTMFATSASADNCVWSVTGLSQPDASSFNIVYGCSIGGSVAATKTVGTRAVGASTCQITVSSGYVNQGTCDSPNIQVPSPDPINQPSGTKICEYGDPIIGTTPGCITQSVGGGSGFIAYSTSKNGYFLMYVTVNTSNCSVSGSNPNYRVDGNCNNYRIYRK